MNKELIKKYKKEFNHWLDGGNLQALHPTKDWIEYYGEDIWTHKLKTKIVISDKYIEFRKALAEGKTVQYNINFENQQPIWEDINTKASGWDITLYCIETLRIKPISPKLNEGDWATVLVAVNGNRPKVEVTAQVGKSNSLKYFRGTLPKDWCYKPSTANGNGNGNVKPWQPKHGEWCWFYNRHTKIAPMLRQFDYTHQDHFYTNDEMIFDNCEPFIGELPQSLKDK